MIYAVRRNVWSYDYTIARDGTPLSRWTWHGPSGRGAFALDGREYAVPTRPAPPRLVDDHGRAPAVLEPDGRLGYLLRVGERTHLLRHGPRGLTRECRMEDGGQVVGHVRRSGGSTELYLPAVDLPVGLFVLGVLTTEWDADAR